MEKQIENVLVDMEGKEERVSCMERVTWKHITICKIDSPMGICSITQETQTGVLYLSTGVGWGGRREGVSKGRVYMYTYG